MLREDEDIFEVDAGPCQKRRVVVKKQRKSNRNPIEACDEHIRIRSRSKQRLTQRLLRRDTLMCKLLVFRQAVNEREDFWDIALGRRRDLDGWVHRVTYCC